MRIKDLKKDKSLQEECCKCMKTFYKFMEINPMIMILAKDKRNSKYRIGYFKDLYQSKFWDIIQTLNSILAIHIDGTIKYYRISQNAFITTKYIFKKADYNLLKSKQQAIEIASYKPKGVRRPQCIDTLYVTLITLKKANNIKRKNDYLRIIEYEKVIQPAMKKYIHDKMKRYPLIIFSENHQSTTIDPGNFIQYLFDCY